MPPAQRCAARRSPRPPMLSTLSSPFAFSGPNSGPSVEYLAEFAKVREATLQA